MNISVDKNVFTKYPKLHLGFLLIDGFDNKANLKEINLMLKDTAKLIKMTFHPKKVKFHELINPWTVAKEDFGKKTTHYHTSVEKLIRKVLKKQNISSNNTLANILKYMALRHIVPYGVDDYHRLDRKMTFKIATGREHTHILKKLKKGDLFYEDNSKILGTKLDHWKSKSSIPTPYTTTALVHFEFLGPIDKEKQKQILSEAAILIKDTCGGKVKTFTLSKRKTFHKI